MSKTIQLSLQDIVQQPLKLSNRTPLTPHLYDPEETTTNSHEPEVIAVEDTIDCGVLVKTISHFDDYVGQDVRFFISKDGDRDKRTYFRSFITCFGKSPVHIKLLALNNSGADNIIT